MSAAKAHALSSAVRISISTQPSFNIFINILEH
jgi:hypothetical protein